MKNALKLTHEIHYFQIIITFLFEMGFLEIWPLRLIWLCPKYQWANKSLKIQSQLAQKNHLNGKNSLKKQNKRTTKFQHTHYKSYLQTF